jgi:hypothetical protein
MIGYLPQHTFPLEATFSTELHETLIFVKCFLWLSEMTSIYVQRRPHNSTEQNFRVGREQRDHMVQSLILHIKKQDVGCIERKW